MLPATPEPPVGKNGNQTLDTTGKNNEYKTTNNVHLEIRGNPPETMCDIDDAPHPPDVTLPHPIALEPSYELKEEDILHTRSNDVLSTLEDQLENTNLELEVNDKPEVSPRTQENPPSLV